MRFSLATLLLLVFWIALALLVWQRREPWARDPKIYNSADDQRLKKFEPLGNREEKVVDEPWKFTWITIDDAPDRVRGIWDYGLIKKMRERGDSWGIRREGAQGWIIGASKSASQLAEHDELNLFFIPPDKSFNSCRRGFLDNDTCVFQLKQHESDVLQYTFFRRRHPEWWWGHFYRPEVWALTALSLGLLWRFVRFVRSRKRVHSAQDTK